MPENKFYKSILLLLLSVFSTVSIACVAPKHNEAVSGSSKLKSPIKQKTLSDSVRTPLMGWSSWNTYRVNISDKLIKKQAKAMVDQGLHKLGYNYINIDDGFFGHRDSLGRMTANPIRFPGGMKPVVDYIHSLGLKAGIYSDAGANTCGSIWDHDPFGVGSGLYGHELSDADTYFNKWGFDYIKIDYCGAGQDLSLNERDRYIKIAEAIKRAVPNRHIRINICRWAFPGTWASKIADSWRISPDIQANWGSVKSIINKNMYLSGMARNHSYNDMDMLEIGRGLSPNEEAVHFGMWCMLSSPLLIGCDLTKIPSTSLKLLKNKELIAIDQDPLGKQAYVVMRDKGGFVFVKDILKKHGNTRALALYNPTDRPIDFNVPLSKLELGGVVRLRDLINGKDLPQLHSDTLRYLVPARSVFIAKATCSKRLDCHEYEAEWAYLPKYNDLGRDPYLIHFADNAPNSHNAKYVTCIGGSPDNYIEWDNVYSSTNSYYNLAIWNKTFVRTNHNGKIMSGPNSMDLWVNGKLIHVKSVNPNSMIFKPSYVKIKLNKGFNVIRIGSGYSWCPDIDRIVLSKIK